MARPESRKIIERKERVAKIVPILRRTYPTAKCSLDHGSPLELLAATILSAQSTDERVNIVTKDLFQKYKTAADFANAPREQLEDDIRSTGFYRNKAKSLQGMAQTLIDRHGGHVPNTMEALYELPGVGRKTANVVLGNAFSINVGIVVDTHVTRLANRLALTDHPSDAVKIEHDLMPVVPQDDWALWSHLLIYHGRSICMARNPKCEDCPILKLCPTGPKIIAEREAAKAKAMAKKKPRVQPAAAPTKQDTAKPDTAKPDPAKLPGARTARPSAITEGRSDSRSKPSAGRGRGG